MKDYLGVCAIPYIETILVKFKAENEEEAKVKFRNHLTNKANHYNNNAYCTVFIVCIDDIDII
jgi:hypothetical protein